MSRLLRWAFNLAAAVSAVLFVGVWASEFGLGVGRGLAYTRANRTCYFIGLYGDGVRACRCRNRPDGPCGFHTFSYSRQNRYGWSSWVFNPENPDVKWFGVGYGEIRFTRRRWPANTVARFVLVSHGTLLFLAAVLPLAWFLHRRHTRLNRPVGLCPSCGYDLRATPTRCPECGAVPAHRTQSST